MKALIKGMLVISALASSQVFALSQGSLVTGDVSVAPISSTGSFDINVTKEDAVQIQDLNDISISKPSSGGAAVTGSDSVCYYATTNDYTITVDSTNGQVLKNGSNTMAYTLTWTDTNTGGGTATWGASGLSDNTATSALTSYNKTSANCGSSTNATIGVSIAASAFDSAVTGKYSDTVSITITGQ